MHSGKDDHHGEHQQRIEHVQKRLRRQQIPILALEVLDHAEYGSDQDEQAAAMQSEQVLVPRDVLGRGLRSRASVDPMLEDDGADEEESEEDDLHEETSDDDVIACAIANGASRS